MAVITPSTFNPLLARCNVRLAQGVPIVDADLNELDDIRKFELQAYLKWFVGDGIPEGTDGFAIESVAQPDDFAIRRRGAKVTALPVPLGTSATENYLEFVGRVLVDGTDAIIQTDINFKAQALYVTQPGAIALSALLGVPVIDPLQPAVPLGTRATVYIDIWERLQTPTEDPTMILAGLGTESCSRIKREWVVRTRTGSTPPAPGDPDHLPGHSYYALAFVERRLAGAIADSVMPGDIVDRRERRLFTVPASIVEDTLGVSALDYRRGTGSPVLSLREAINALMRGELPSTPDTSLAPFAGLDLARRAFLFDSTNGLIAVWQTNRFPTPPQVTAARLDLTSFPGSAFTAAQQVSSITAHFEPSAGLLPNGDLLVAYQVGSGPSSDIVFKRGPFASLVVPGPAEVVVANTAAVPETNPYVIVAGTRTVVFLNQQGVPSTWQYRRFNHATNTFIDLAGTVQLSAKDTSLPFFHAAFAPATTRIWVAFRVTTEVNALEFDVATGLVTNETATGTLPAGGLVNEPPFVLPRASGETWVFYGTTTGIRFTRFATGAWQAPQLVTGSTAPDREPCAVEAPDGSLWLFFTRGALGAGDIFAMRLNPVTGAWGAPRQLTFSTAEDRLPHALLREGTVFLFWTSTRDDPAGNLFFKRIVISI